MGIKLGLDWKKLEEKCITWPTSGKPCKEVYKNYFIDKLLCVYYNEDGRFIASNARDFFCECEIATIFGNA